MTCIVGSFNSLFQCSLRHNDVITLLVEIKLFRDVGRFLDMLLLKFCEYAWKTYGNIDYILFRQ